MKKEEMSSLDLPTLQRKKEKLGTVLKVIYGFIILYLSFVVYFLLTKDFDINRFGPLVAGFGGLAVVISNLKQQEKLMEEEIASRQ